VNRETNGHRQEKIRQPRASRKKAMVGLVTVSLLAALALAIVVAASASPAIQQAIEDLSGGYNLSWWTVDGGGDTHASNGDYTLGGTAGQPDAGAATAGEYTLNGGFWAGSTTKFRVYLPAVWRQSP
jgi:hypothetical protein